MIRTAIAVLACTAGPVFAQENPAGRGLAATCWACHGPDGRSVTRDVASLAGMPREQIVTQVRAFRDGSRPSTVMQQIARGYSEQQIELIADYFSRRGR